MSTYVKNSWHVRAFADVTCQLSQILIADKNHTCQLYQLVSLGLRIPAARDRCSSRASPARGTSPAQRSAESGSSTSRLRPLLDDDRVRLSRSNEENKKDWRYVVRGKFWSKLFAPSSTWGICTRRASKLYKTRSRLYRSLILKVNTRWKTLAEIYTMHSVL